MAKVRVTSVRGSVKNVSQKKADYLVRRGWAVVESEPEPEVPVQPEPEDPPAIDELDGMSYYDLRALATEEGVEPEGRKKDDYIAALRYNRRDMRAEE